MKTVDSVGLFETEIYMSKLHNRHGGGKTSLFKRCLFLRSIGIVDVVNILVAAIKARPSHAISICCKVVERLMTWRRRLLLSAVEAGTLLAL